MTSLVKRTAIERVRHTVSLVPRGKIASYGQVADLAGLPGRARYVGYCLRNTPASERLPWHRIVRSDGKLAFPPQSDSAHTQQTLLHAEGIRVQNNRVSISEFGWQPDLGALLHEIPY
ncbi:MGMT family protein [Alteromonas gilva]|uniref:MGMT family protein n=1 Tax=Alteromonas gilva TaxID=2987522 RepID=A0ABT5KWP1_9ALTE|nr:MGMT family protein [Alteromonas gilva]MDC8829185.1 MGMT family protein [Alteromonas gilva]